VERGDLMLEIGVKIILILLLAGIIGWNREKHGRPAGFRTHILVGIGSTIVMMVSILMHEKYPEADPARIAAQVISGIGFLGAGTILVQGSTVTGLTTAASIWTTAAIGLAVGAGFYMPAILGALIVFSSLMFFTSLEVGKRKIVHQELTFKLDLDSLDFYQEICTRLEEQDCELKETNVEKDNINKVAIINIKLAGSCPQIEKFNSWFLEREELKEFSWKEQ
jgi:putative Mg2+ transporter-C (MgtC) family protein